MTHPVSAPVANPDGRAAWTPGHVVGVDLGGTKIRAGLATAAGTLVAERDAPTAPNAHGLAQQIASLVRLLAADARLEYSRVAATGVGGAGVPDGSSGSFVFAPNLDGIAETPFARELAARLGHPVVLDNDANMAALGELHAGIGRSHDNFVFVSVGTGIGMGIVAEGRLLRGARGAAGEIGFLPLGADPLAERNHRRGPLEEAVAGDALAARYRSATGKPVTAQQIFELAAAGELQAAAVLDTEARWVATALVAVAAVVDPAVFLVGGGIGGRTELLAGIHPWLARLGAPELDIRLSELGPSAPVIGAVRLAIEALGLQRGAS